MQNGITYLTLTVCPFQSTFDHGSLSILKYIWPWQFVHFRVYLTLAVCPVPSIFDLGSLSISEYIWPWQFVHFRVHILWNGQTAKVKCTLKWTNCHGQMYSEMDKLSRSNRLFHSAKIRALTIFHLCLNIQCLFPLHSMPD
jgi:hypothetical protein